MFCENCGKEVKPEQAICLSCGVAVKKKSSLNLDLGGKINKAYILKNINLVLATVSVILLFLPLFGLNAFELGYNNILKVTGFGSLLGMSFTDGTRMSGSIFALLLFVFPILLIASKYVKELAKFKRPIMLISPIGSIIALFIVKSGITAKITTTVTTASGFWLYLLVSTALLVVGYFEFKNIPLNKESLSNIMNQNAKS